jgi:hypothetical protein
MADAKITALTADTSLISTDVIPVVDVTAGATKKITARNLMVLPAGTASAGDAPLKFTSGTNLTTAEAGAMEYDGKVHYSTHAASERGVAKSVQHIQLTSNFTTAGGTTALQKAFNAPTNGALTVAANTTYGFEFLWNASTMSATSGTFSFGLGGTATYSRVAAFCIARKTSAATGTAGNFTMITAATATVVTGANTTTTGHMSVIGQIVIGSAGTIIPSFATSVANATVVLAGSYFRIWPLGADTVQSVGNWA